MFHKGLQLCGQATTSPILAVDQGLPKSFKRPNSRTGPFFRLPSTTSTIATTTTFYGHKWRTGTSTHTHAPRKNQDDTPPSTINNVPFNRTSNIFDGRDWAVGRGGEGRGTGGHWRPEQRVRNTMPRFAGSFGTWVHHHSWFWVEWHAILLSGPWVAH